MTSWFKTILLVRYGYEADLYWENEKVRLDYRPVHMNTLDDEMETIPPKARVY
ncbi:succinate dehydrogenase [ubiquinone] flavoprotein subunit 1, mitochondrial [Senna tora]|uniref:Succinate dehydrogenase [ubiquinone] flavoprotein subunit 1, mitochondrial n=1 Tax=Senna tora TaxID=362788 RepID=A0A834SYP8_9FABA|nr:succinate dehydrogenase [ubiquinone] flavoprotein subunit 1, mitochondrial [Senna tora]